MRSIQITALILWGFILIVAAFVLGQFLVAKGIFDVTTIITGSNNEEKQNNDNVQEEVDDLENDVIISKVGQETVRIGQNIALDYFSSYYKDYVNYIVEDEKLYKNNEKIAITENLANDYVFYAASSQSDMNKYKIESISDKVLVKESEINSFVDRMFEKDVMDEYKNISDNGYNKIQKRYNIVKKDREENYTQELSSIENITSNQVRLAFNCKETVETKNKVVVQDEKQINIYAVYRGGRYIVTDVEKIEK